MMMNLFSSFDPATSFNLSLNWLANLFIMLLMPLTYWMLPNQKMMMTNMILNKLHQEFKMSSGKFYYKSMTLMLISMFLFIMITNTMGMFPYIFVSSSHVLFTLSLAMPMWLSFMIFGWMNNSTHMFIHLVPENTPPMLMSFMVCIETISNTIRPLTLSIRLMANMIAGHLVLTLLGNFSSYTNMLTYNFVIMIQLLLLSLEFAVAFIQAYVFSTLLTLYSNEVI